MPFSSTMWADSMKSGKMAPQKRNAVPAKRKRVIRSKPSGPTPNVHNQAELLLQRVRKIFVEEDDPEKLSVSPQHANHPLSVLLRHIGDALFLSLSYTRPPDSIQEDLMGLLRTGGQPDIEAQYELACKSARGILFDCAVQQLMYFLSREAQGDLEKALYRALLIEDPSILHGSAEVSEYVHDGVMNSGSVFLQGLTDDFRNAERRRSRLIIDDQAWVMASNWTNPHCPLWLMERAALFEACAALAPNTFTRDAVNNRLKRLGFKRSSTTPIIEVRKKGSRATIIGFEVAEHPFTILVGKEYPFSFLPSGRFTEEEIKMKEEAFAEDRRRLDAIAKTYGKKSIRYRSVFSAMHVKPDLPPLAPPGYRVYKK